MQQPAATLDNTDGYDPHPQHMHPRKGAGMKFAYASGARPLSDYTIKRGIGVGGFGEVYFATSDAGKEVALKRVQRNLEVEVRGVTQCLNLRHTNLIDLYDIKYDDAGQAWVVMEYVSGESLKDVVERHPDGLPPEEALRWFNEIAQGVAYLHDNGIVHRDLKPGNIFADDDAVKIGDYGLSKFISCSRRSGQTESVGTFHYMAPEIGKGVYGKEIDIYALGVILYELLTGRVPFEGESSQEIIMKHLTADPDLSPLNPRFREVIRRSLLKDPDQRYSSVREMTDALKAGPSASATAPASFRPAPAPAPAPAASRPATPPRVVQESSKPIYIGDEDSGIEMGPVKEHAPARKAHMQPRRTQPGVVRAQTQQKPLYIKEPIAAAAVRGGRSAANWWRTKLSTPLKVIVLAVGVCLLVAGAPWLFPLGMLLGASYVLYLGVRAIVMSFQSGRTSPVVDANVRQARSERSGGERAAEWIGSLLGSAIICAIFSTVMMLAAGRAVTESIDDWAFFSWLTITTTGGAWALLSVGRFWEKTSKMSAIKARGVALVLGAVIGVGAFGLQTILLAESVDPPFANARNYVSLGAFDADNLPIFYDMATQRPQLLGFVLFFAGLFFILGWWKQVDPLRRTRFSFWTTAVCVLCGWILPFPQPWGLMIAAATSVAVQLSSPWVSRESQARSIQPQEA